MIRSIALIIMMALVPTGAFAANTALQVDFLMSGHLQSDGTANAGGKVYTCDAGTVCGPSTSDPKTTWQDSGKVSAETNPVILDSNGKANIYADGLYKFQIYDSDDVLIETIDNVSYVVTSGTIVQAQATLTPSSQTIDTTIGTYLCNAQSGAVTTDFSGVSAVGNTGKRFTFKKTDSTLNTCTIDVLSSQTIDGVTTAVLRNQYDDITIESDGTNWGEVRGMVWSRAALFHNAVTIFNATTIHGTLAVNTISERSSGVGVTIDGVILKDSIVNATSMFTNSISEKTSGVGITFNNTVSLSKGADIASIANLTALITLPDGNYFDVTGIANIGAINTVGVGTTIKLHFDSTVTLINNATDLILPGVANITTTSGDEYEFTEYASGDWRVTGRVLNSPSPSFCARPAAATLNLNGDTLIDFETEDFDTNSDYAAGSSSFLPTIAGKYSLTTQVEYTAGAINDDVRLIIKKNGSLTGGAERQYKMNAAANSLNLSIIVEANGVDDNFEVYGRNVTTTTGDTTGTAARNFFCGSRVGQ